MDIATVLENTVSNDGTVRQAAERQLQQAAQENFPAFLQILSQQLANESNSRVVRSAAALFLKNEFSGRDRQRLSENQAKWSALDVAVKTEIRSLALTSLASADHQASNSSAQFIAAIAAIDLPQKQWPDLVTMLVHNVNSNNDNLKQASLTTIGYICESEDPELRESLTEHANGILTAVVQGARKEETNNDVRFAAIEALTESLDFIRRNFESEGERNYIMQVVCEATQSTDSRIQQSSFACLNRIMSFYYDKMRFYMEKALFGLTILGMKQEDEEVSKLAIEFWCTVCEEELTIEEDNAQASQDGLETPRAFHNFARVATNEVVPVLLDLLTKQDEDATDDEYNVSRAAYQCLCLYSQTVTGLIIPPVLAFVEANLRQEDWRLRDAAVSAFGAIMDGPDLKMLDPLIKQALPLLVGMMSDKVVIVKDSAAYALGRICDCCGPAINSETHLPSLIQALFQGLNDSPKMASSCCWSLMNLAENFGSDSPDDEATPLSPYFAESVTHLLRTTERPDADNQLRTASYEVLCSFVTNVGQDQRENIFKLLNIIVERLENTIQLQSQVVSVDDRVTLEEMQTSLASVIVAIVQRLGAEIKPAADRIMQVLLQTRATVPPSSTVPEALFAAIGSMANALEEDFAVYLDAFTPYLLNALGNPDEPQLCSIAIGLVSDIVRSVGEKSVQYCDQFMNHLLRNLQTLGNSYKPAILQCFGDIAQAIGGAFETYLPVVMTVLQQASSINAGPDANLDQLEYVLSLREGIMDAYDGVIIALKSSGKVNVLAPSVQPIFGFVAMVQSDPNKTEPLLRSAMGVLGDLADAFPNGEFAEYYRADWVGALIKEVRSNRDFSMRTSETARWTREQVKRQTSLPH